MRRLGLRARVTAGFAAGAMILSASMALLSYELTRRSLLAERERTAIRAAYFDAAVVRAGLATDEPDIIDVLRSLDSGGTRRAVLRRDGEWYARSADAGFTHAVPVSLQRLVERGSPGIQRVRTDAGGALVVGVPLSSSTAFYEIASLQELEGSLRVMAVVLTLVAISTTGAGAALGWYTTRYVLRPLRSVADAAQEITAGDLRARLDPATAPELERLTTSFNQMVDQLSQRLERDRRFAADVSHELRSPLQTLAAAASVLNRRQAGLDPRTSMAVNLIVEEVERFQSLVADLLELARGDRPPERSPVNMVDLARRVCRSRGVPADIVVTDTHRRATAAPTADSAAGPDADTDNHGSDADVTWHVDRRRFEHVVGNLLDNAQRHGGGALAVRIGRENGVRFLEVDDQGPGIHPDDRHAVFDRFVRGHSANARGDSDGTGLGLALVAQHVTAHGGRVQVTDRPGGGARFRVELPEWAP